MADERVWGVKVSDETEKRADALIKASGSNKKSWFEKMVALAEVNNLKEAAPDYTQDISELEVHTTRIYELVTNMIQRANYLRDDAVKGLENKLESKELTIAELQANVKTLKESLKQLEETSKQSEADKQTLTEQIAGLRSTNDNNQALIQEYREKIDGLSSLINEYKSYATENVELKEKHAAETNQMKAEFQQKESRLVSSIDEYKQTVHDQQEQIEKLTEKLNVTIQNNEKELESLKVNFNNRLTQLTTAKDLEKERAVIEVERKFQDKIQQLHDQYNEKIARLYEKFERIDSNEDK
jgi:DNA repair exonuclease SbcCD ATPase subunit